VVWSDEPVTIAIDEALRPRRQSASQRHDAELTPCEWWLLKALAVAGGRMLAADVRGAGQGGGFPLAHPPARPAPSQGHHSKERLRAGVEGLLATG
jgi:hypothetical protein